MGLKIHSHCEFCGQEVKDDGPIYSIQFWKYKNPAEAYGGESGEYISEQEVCASCLGVIKGLIEEAKRASKKS